MGLYDRVWVFLLGWDLNYGEYRVLYGYLREIEICICGTVWYRRNCLVVSLLRIVWEYKGGMTE